MKSSNEILLTLEVLEDRLALNGAFSGAIGAGAPSYPPVTGSTVSASNAGQPFFRVGFGDLNLQPVSQTQQVQNVQSQLLALQAAQTAMIDQFFSELQSFVQILNLRSFLIL
jgi:hypothetical protein